MTILDAPLAAPVFDLARYGEATAVVCGDRAVTYTELDRLVEERRALLGTGRRLVLLECANV